MNNVILNKVKKNELLLHINLLLLLLLLLLSLS